MTVEEYTGKVLDLLEELGVPNKETVHTVKFNTESITVGRKDLTKRNALGEFVTVVEHYTLPIGADEEK